MKSEAPLVFSDTPIDPSLLPGPVAWGWIVAAAAALLLTLAALAILRFRNRPKQQPDADRQLAFREALSRLDKAAALPARAAATEASLAIRHYLCSVAGDPSLFETHEEFLARHPSIEAIPPATLDALTDTLRRLAEIKYRKADEPADTTPLLEQSREILRALDHSPAA